MSMIRVTVWNEHLDDLRPEVQRIYPEGIHGCIASFLREDAELSVRTATLADPECGLSEALLSQTDVLVYWAHQAHERVTDECAERVRQYVLRGMGFIPLHSAHMAKPLRLLLGTSMTLRWRHNDRERLTCVSPGHPIAAGVPQHIELPREEMYGEYFDIPRPDDVVFLGWFAGGEVFRSGCTFTRGLGKIFYFQPGHEEYPIYHQPEIQRIIRNAVHWAAPALRRETPLDNIAVRAFLEEERKQ